MSVDAYRDEQALFVLAFEGYVKTVVQLGLVFV